MSEYCFVEKPFLTQLQALGWEVIDQGEGIPKDPMSSHRFSRSHAPAWERIRRWGC